MAHALDTLKRWLSAIAMDQLAHVDCVYVIDRKELGRPHIHALLGELDEPLGITRRRLEGLLRQEDPLAGFDEIELFNPWEGAAWYIAKKNEPWDWLVGCPRRRKCRRRHGCILGRSAW